MADFQITFEWDDAAAQRALRGLQDLGRDLSPVMAEIAEDVLLPGVQQHFHDEQDHEGNPWPDLKPATWARKRTSAMLRESDDLYLSLVPGYGKDFAELSTDRPYAALHQFGGTPDMAPGPAAVPARPYMGISAEMGEQITEIVEDELRQAGR